MKHTHIWSSARRCCSFDLNRTCGAWSVACDAGTACPNIIYHFLLITMAIIMFIFMSIYTHTPCRRELFVCNWMQTCPSREFGASLHLPSLYSVLDTAYGGDRSTTSPWCHCKWANDQPSPVFEESTNHRLGLCCYSTVPEAKCKSQTIVHWLQRIWWRRCPAFMWSPRRSWRCHLKIVQKAFWFICCSQATWQVHEVQTCWKWKV